MLFHQGVCWRQEWRLGSSLQNMLPASADGKTVERLLHTTLHSWFVVCMGGLADKMAVTRQQGLQSNFGDHFLLFNCYVTLMTSPPLISRS